MHLRECLASLSRADSNSALMAGDIYRSRTSTGNNPCIMHSRGYWGHIPLLCSADKNQMGWHYEEVRGQR